MNWEPTRFGYRKAEVVAANAAASAAGDRLALAKLDVASAAASAYMVVAEAHEQVRSAEADLARRHTFANSIHVLVDNQLRPGADASQADAEVAAAKTRLIRSQTAEKIDLAALAELLSEENKIRTSYSILRKMVFPEATRAELLSALIYQPSGSNGHRPVAEVCRPKS